MFDTMTEVPAHLAALDTDQHRAATHEGGPLLVVAGAGTGKTRTLVARVADLVHRGVPPDRILLLTFTRRAARDMLHRARTSSGDDRLRRVRGGTFHSVAHRVLRAHGAAVGLSPGFTILDEGDARDLVALVRADLGLGETEARFPRADAIVRIASRVANTREPLSGAVAHAAPWCAPHLDAIREVLRGVRDRKQSMNAVDFDDLLLYWHALLGDPDVGRRLRETWDHVLVDEFQDTNAIQGQIVDLLVADHGNVTVVGDDAQSIYRFRGATVDNILRFTERHPTARMVVLDRNYRSVQPILDIANDVIAQAPDRLDKSLRADRRGGVRPTLVTCADEAAQSDWVCEAILDARERGIDLREQAVLVRTGHHSHALELELSRRDIPFVKYGGLQFLQAAHVKDLAAMLRLLDNPADELAWHRVLLLLEGVGPATARRLQDRLGVGRWSHGDPADDSPMARLLATDTDPLDGVPSTARAGLSALRAAWADAARPDVRVGPQIERLGVACRILWPRVYDDASARLADVDRLAALAGEAHDRHEVLADLTLEPPSSTADLAGPPHLDDDWLTISTIHSAKGLEWSAVHVLHAADGNIPSDMALRDRDEVEEERRLLYVAVTRARDELHVTFPLRYHIDRYGHGARHGWAQLSRFLTEVRPRFDERHHGEDRDPVLASGAREPTRVDAALDALWDA